jgi:hypothetical protein
MRSEGRATLPIEQRNRRRRNHDDSRMTAVRANRAHVAHYNHLVSFIFTSGACSVTNPSIPEHFVFFTQWRLKHVHPYR